MSADKDDILEKLKKILALADPSKNPSQAQVEVAMQKAQELCLKHGLDLASVRAKATEDGKPQTFDTTNSSLDLGKTVRSFHWPVLQVLQAAFEVRAIFCGTQVMMVGEKYDLALAIGCFPWLEEQYPRLAKAWWTGERGGTGKPPSAERKGFYSGLTRGLIEKNGRARKKAAEASASFALVLVDKKKAVDLHVAKLFPTGLTSRKDTSRRDPSAADAGYQKGKTMKLAVAALE